MKKLVPLLVGGVIGALIVGVTCKVFKLGPAEHWSTSMCEATVKLSLVSDGTPTGMKIVKDPSHPVCLAVGQPMNWVIVDKGTVKIVFETFNTTQGPFAADTGLLNSDGTQINARRGIYEAKNANTTTGSLNIKTPGAEDYQRAWQYTVEWTPPGSTDPPIKLDPVVCIRR